jgi:methylated-DNA-[protein]-cysteine S-methyltransferase
MSYDVPGWGSGELWMRGPVLLAHEFRYVSAPAEVLTPPKGAQAPPTATLAPIRSRVANGSVSSPHLSVHMGTAVSALELVERFHGFLAGAPVSFDDIELDLTWATPFQRELTEALRAIPRGEVVTYGELAALAGRPGAARAAGAFCATNRFAIVVPCHRVVAAGGIGGYGPDGVPIKRRLLALEGVSA